MQKRTLNIEPLARKEGLVVEHMPDEVLVYDLDRHKAHCLNRTAAFVWQHCDGRSDAADIARRMEKEFDATVNEELVYLAFDQLGKDHLLEKRASLPVEMVNQSRRQVMRRIGLATAVALPVVISIMSPTAANAVTCIPSGIVCSTTVVCCSTLSTCTPPQNCP
jgi:hypothetical protein